VAPRGDSAAIEVQNVRICNLRMGDRLTLGLRTPEGILDVSEVARARGLEVPRTTDDVLRGHRTEELRALAAGAERNADLLVPEDEAVFGPCVSAPEKIIMMGFNYRRHCREVKLPIPATPTFFSKYANALLGHRGTIVLPSRVASQFDYEAELVVVVGRTARDVSEEDALSYVFGYCSGNDFSARDLQFKTTQYMLGKTCDGFAPLGPWLVSADEVPDPQQLSVQSRVNGELRQSSSTSDMIFTCAQLVAYASQHMTLQPGDLIFTGTPEGVIQGRPERERVWLKPGDEVSVSIGDLGELRVKLA
jgi:2-keto-4-pentenoate hydratase/2-oxohepta-3-ene-1,7-dioic acid hydratase in catechol pathway